jgi:GDP-4-dehydro-6-deoxy-D-mannose reductase
VRTLITGATGCLGPLVANRLAADPQQEVWLSARTPLACDRYIACDLANPGAIRGLVERVRPDRIFHLAASFTGRYDEDWCVNADSSRHLLESLLSCRLAARVILMGSAAEYGHVRPEENPIREDHALQPVTVYGVTKAQQTLLASYYSAAFTMDVVVARLFNLMARGLSPRLFVGRVEGLIDRYTRGEVEFLETGSLSAIRDYVPADQAVDQLLAIAEVGASGNVYHVASGRPVVMRDLLAELLSEAGLGMQMVREGREAGCGSTEVSAIYADVCKTRVLLAGRDAAAGRVPRGCACT